MLFEDDDARMIAESAAAVVPPAGDLSRIRGLRHQAPGFSAQIFRKMTGLGWFGILVPEAAGGAGLGLVETCALLHVLGRGLVPEPVLGAILAQTLLAEALPPGGDDRIVVLAWQDRIGSLDWTCGCDGGRLNGRKAHVVGAGGADAFAVLTERGVALVDRASEGLTVTLVPLQDGGFAGDLVLRDVVADFHAVANAQALLDMAMVAHSAYLLGMAERGVELTLQHLRTRRQFDRPIGSFQALQHRVVDLKVQTELLRAAVVATARRLDAGLSGPRRIAAVSRVKARAAEVSMHMAREIVQLHGAMGYTDEADAGLFVRKAMTEANRFGSAALHRGRYLAARNEAAA
jgi:alkylation response protein AidB-like acyl-CoA dehydrogenase